MIRWYRLRRAAKQLANLSRADRARVLLAAMTPKESAEMLREAIDSGRDAEIGNEVLALMADRAADGATDSGRTILERMSAAWRAGREIKFSTYPVTLLRDGETPELVFAVEEAFTNKEH